MTTDEKTTMRRTFVSRIAAVTILVCTVSVGSAIGQSKKEEKKTEAPRYTVFGRDPKAFVDAEEMFALPIQGYLDDLTAKAILGNLEKATKESEPVSQHLWLELDRLRAARMSKELIIELQEIANKVVVRDMTPSLSMSVASKDAFEKGNSHYESAEFDKAVESYRASLKNHPAYWDAWNNMALAEMHRNNDLIALFVLSALTRNDPRYAGGFLNLAVCLERLGQDAAAYNIAASVVIGQNRIPMAQFNMAWFENARGKYYSASTHLLRAMEADSEYTVAKWLRAINSMESGYPVGAEDLKALPKDDRLQGIPKIVSRPVTSAAADAFSGDTIVARIPKGNRLVISEKRGNWSAVYWPVSDVKLRLWVRESNLGSVVAIPRISIPAGLEFIIVHTAARASDARKAAARLEECGVHNAIFRVTDGNTSFVGGIHSGKEHSSIAIQIAKIVADIEPVEWHLSTNPGYIALWIAK